MDSELRRQSALGALLLASLCAACSDPATPSADAAVDAPAAETGSADLGTDASIDGSVDAAPPDVGPDGPPPTPCTLHYDCPQGSYCYYQKCVTDPDYPVYHCGKQDSSGNDTCPPGRWCIDKQGKKSTCAESGTYSCSDACDCGPAHCCMNKICVKDTADPWIPGGTATGGACTQGSDATYCTSDPACHEGRQAYAKKKILGKFLAYNPKSNKLVIQCSSDRCFGTACNCQTGEQCVDTLQDSPQPGKACLLLSGGSCVSNALAEAIFGYKPSDLLPCCSASCPKGKQCDAGWVSDRKWAYKRIVGTCGSCGNGTCDPGEWHNTCHQDCDCADGTCGAGEVKTCFQDCAACGNGVCEPGERVKMGLFGQSMLWMTECPSDCKCGDGTCDPGESVNALDSGYCPADCNCGDGTCGMAESCSQDCVCSDSNLYLSRGRICGDGKCDRMQCTDPESCLSCPRDCGTCLWELGDRTVQSSMPALDEVRAAWGDQTGGFFVAGRGKKGEPVVLRYDGVSWSSIQLSVPTFWPSSIWASSASDVFLVGMLPSKIPFHYDGTTWSPMVLPAALTGPDGVMAVWGRGPKEVYAVGTHLVRYDGNAKLQWDLVAQPPGVAWGIRGPPGTGGDLYVALQSTAVYRCNVSSKSCTTLGNPPGATSLALRGLWGTTDGSKLDLYVASMFPPGFWHHDGSATGSWTAVTVPSTTAKGHTCLDTGLFATDAAGALFFDGKTWTKLAAPPASLSPVWGNAQGIFGLVAKTGSIYRHDGTTKTWKLLTSWMASGGETSAHDLLKPGGVWGTSGADVYRVSRSKVLRFDGKAWKVMSVPTSALLYGVWGASASDLYAVGGDLVDTPPHPKATILHHDGTGWSQETAPMDGPLLDVWGDSSGTYAVGIGGTLWRRESAGWKSVASISAEWLAGVWGCSPSKVAAVGKTPETARRPSFEPGVVALFDTKAKSVISTSITGVTRLYDVWCDAKGTIVAVGADVTSLAKNESVPCIVTCSSASGALSCTKVASIPLSTPQPIGGALRGIWGASASDLYAVGSHGATLHYNGKKWSQAPMDIRSAGHDWGCEDLLGIWGTKSDLFVTTAAGGAVRLERLP